MRTLANDWNQEVVHNPLQFSVKIQNERLSFSIQFDKASSPDPSSLFNQFQAELWKYDVGELFLGAVKMSNYLEINLNEKGAWWMQVFKSEREIDHSFTLKNYREAVEVNQIEGLLTLSVSRAFLRKVFNLQIESLTANVTAIVGRPQQFLSLAKIDLVQPDFHQPKSFLPIDVITD